MLACYWQTQVPKEWRLGSLERFYLSTLVCLEIDYKDVQLVEPLFRNTSGWNEILAACISRNPGQKLFLNLELNMENSQPCPADISCPGVCMLNCNIQIYSSNILNFQQLKASVFCEHTQRLTWTPILRSCFFDHYLVGSDARGQNVPIQLDCKTNKLCQRVQRGHRSGCRLRGRVGSFGHVLMLKKDI